MNPKPLIGLILIGLASASAGFGLQAYFSDTATSTGNLFKAGTLDLRANGAESISGTFQAGQMLPGDCVEGTITIHNEGTIQGGDLDLDIGVVATHTQGPDGLGDLRKALRIDILSYAGSPRPVPDVNGNGFADLADWAADNGGTRDLAEPNAGGSAFVLRLCLDEEAGNELQGDTADFEVRFFLAQGAASDLVAPLV